MAEKKIELAQNTNETDAHVVFDPKIKDTTVAKVWQPLNSDEEKFPDRGQLSTGVDHIRQDGIYIPIIRINKLVVNNQDLVSFQLKNTDFKPSVEVVVRKSDMQVLDTPGMVNKITVVMIPPENGTYKKISLDFYIKSVQTIGNNVRYVGDFFLPALEKKTNRVLKQDGNNKLSTYQLLETIANECELGFATTNNCKEISDTKIRLIKSQNLQEVINEHIKFGGLDSDSFFLSWIDPYKYIVMCNLAWVLNQSVAANQLSMKVLAGATMLNSADFQNNPEKFSDNTFRTFTNLRQDSMKISNKIKSYNWIVNNQAITSQGTNNTYFLMEHFVNKGSNSIVSENVTIEEDTADGRNFKDVYNFEKMKFLGIEMASEEDGETPVLFQQKRRDAFLAKLNSKILKVELVDFNIGLERGMLINLAIFEYEKTKKGEILRQTANLSKDGDVNLEDTSNSGDGTDINEILNNENAGVINLSVSGIYFINGIDYTYTPSSKQIKQTLYLIRQIPSTNFTNYSSLPKIDLNQGE